MLTSWASLKRVGGKRAPLRSNQETLSLIADEERKANITEAQAEALRKFAASMYLSESLQIVLEPLFEETQRRLEDRFDGLLQYLSRLEWR